MEYTLYKNGLTSGSNDHVARVLKVTSHDTESIISHMSAKGTTLTRTDILAVLNSFFETMEEFIAKGETINTDLFKVSFSISGVFNDATDVFDKTRHSVKINLSSGKMLKDATAKIHVEKVAISETIPSILKVRDSTSGSVNDRITSQGIVEITGNLIKVVGDNAENGVYLVANDGTKYKATSIAENRSTRLFVGFPMLTAGKYTLQITTQYNKERAMLKDSRTGTFDTPLTVV